jgi:hypothetical protein
LALPNKTFAPTNFGGGDLAGLVFSTATGFTATATVVVFKSAAEFQALAVAAETSAIGEGKPESMPSIAAAIVAAR